MINCNAASLILELNSLKHVVIQNCTIGKLTFRKVQNALIKNCNNVFDEGIPTSLKFYNTSVKIKNITIEHDNISESFQGIWVDDYTSLHVEHSKFVNNTVKRGIIKILKSSPLIMSHCTILENHASEYPGVIHVSESFVHLKNMYFSGNMAINRGGVIFIENMSFLQIKNCTFKNNSVDKTHGHGGAILSLNNSFLDLSYSIFNHNEAAQGGAIYQETSKMVLNECSFFGNAETAIVGLFNSEISIMSSIFQNNLAKHSGGAVGIENSVLNVSQTTFENNTQICTSIVNVYQPVCLRTDLGGGAIYLYKSTGIISKVCFYKNSAAYWGGSVYALNCSLLISDTTFENNLAGVFGGAMTGDGSFVNVESSNFINNSISNKEMGEGGGLYLVGNSTIKVSNVLLSKCHAYKGGAIAGNFTTIIMVNSSIINNTGSATYLKYGKTFEIKNCTFLNNSSPENGGAIRCLASIVKIVNTSFSQNDAVIGGALSINSMSKLHAKNCSFTDNATYNGGAMSVIYSDCNISDSKLSHNIATEGGGVALKQGYIAMTNCLISSNTAFEHGRVINAVNSNLLLTNCWVYNNSAKGNGGVVSATTSATTIMSSIFQMNKVLGAGGVFHVTEGTMVWRNSWFGKNIAIADGGVLFLAQQAVINITKSICFQNKASDAAGVLFVGMQSKIQISDAKIKENSAYKCGALAIHQNSILELYGSQVEGNTAKIETGALCISDNSLLVALNSSFKGNRAYQDSSIRIQNGTVYVENCTFVENQVASYGGTVSTLLTIKLKVSNTVFAQNKGYDLFYYVDKDYQVISKIETYRCLFVHGNISLKSQVENFEEVAFNGKVIGQPPFLNQSFFKPTETPYASSK